MLPTTTSYTEGTLLMVEIKTGVVTLIIEYQYGEMRTTSSPIEIRIWMLENLMTDDPFDHVESDEIIEESDNHFFYFLEA